MWGRYGADELGKFIALVALIIMMAGVLFGNSYVMYCLGFLATGYNIWRMCSKNKAARCLENTRFLNVWMPVSRFFKSRFARLANIRRYRYFKCPECKCDLRVPRGKGNITLTCPKCRRQFDARS